ncbi:MAG: DUF5131 family protein, partial [Gammaproteobacteria bacterium]|nr:DUF5131 family protein [Gammaproteobacteria bacterium]
PQHTFQVLTKRPDRMHSYLSRPDVTKRIWWAGRPMSSKRGKDHYAEVPVPRPGCGPSGIGIRGWPLSNVWLGVTAENQAAWDERVLLLCQTPAAKRFVSYEPALGLIDIDPKRWAKPSECFQAPPKLDWLICGGESGPHARPMHPDWARSVRDQCQAAGVPFFFKKWGQWQIASHENGHRGSMMPDSGERYTWVGSNGKTYNPSAPAGLDCWAMAKVGKKAAGRELDGRTWEEMPCQ